MEYPKIQEIITPENFKQDELAEVVINNKMIEIYARILLICGVLLAIAVIF